MSASQEVLAMGFIGGKNLLTTVPLAIGLGGAAMKSLISVDEGHVGIKTWLNRATTREFRKSGRDLDELTMDDLHGIVNAGLYPVAPFAESIKPISIQNRPSDVEEVPVDCEGEQLLVSASILWAVRADGIHPYRAKFGLSNEKNDSSEAALTQAVTNKCAGGLRAVIGGLSKHQLDYADLITDEMHKECDDSLLRFGVQLKGVELKSATATVGEKIYQAGSLQSAAILGAIASKDAVGAEQALDQLDDATTTPLFRAK